MQNTVVGRAGYGYGCRERKLKINILMYFLLYVLYKVKLIVLHF